MPLFDRATFEARVSDTPDALADLSGATMVLAQDALLVMSDRWRWDTMTDSQWDDLSEIISQAMDELYVT